MPPWIAALLGVVEGLTEYLPVSSTGHLLLVSRWLDLHGEAVDSFDIVIQLGAILAVVVHYRALLLERASGLFKKEEASLQLFAAIAAGFVPTAAAGFLLRKAIKRLLFGPIPIAVALIAGGVLMIVWGKLVKKPGEGLTGLQHVTPKRGFYIGLGQCLSLCPGASRSMCTILAGELTGLSSATAAEFSFLLGLPTLGAATLYEGMKARHALLHDVGAANIAIGLVVSFFVAWGVIAAFIRYLQRHSLAAFGVYRVAIGIVAFVTLVR